MEKPDALPKKIITTDELKATLYDKSDVLKTINNTFTEKDKALKVARNECENKRKILESRDKNRRNEILQIINDP